MKRLKNSGKGQADFYQFKSKQGTRMTHATKNKPDQQCHRSVSLCYESCSHGQYRQLNKAPTFERNKELYLWFKQCIFNVYFSDSDTFIHGEGVLLMLSAALFNPVIVSPATHPFIRLSSVHTTSPGGSCHL